MPLDSYFSNLGIGAITEESRGILWFGTPGTGVIHFDGTHAFLITDESGLTNSRVYAILEDSHNILWFGTSRGFSRYDGMRFTTYANTLKVHFIISLEHIGRLGLLALVRGSWNGIELVPQ